MRIMVVYPGHLFSTWDVARGYEQALRLQGHDVSRFDYHTRLSFYMVSLQAWEDVNAGFEAKQNDAALLASEALAVEVIDRVPDVVLVVCGLNLHRRAYDLLHRLGVPVVLLTTEAPYADDMHARIIQQGHVAATLVNERSSDLPGRVEYLPHSYNPRSHWPRRVMGTGPDVYFFGTLWPERAALFAPLMGRPRVDIGGVQAAGDESPAWRGNDVLARAYAAARVNLNHHRTIRADGEGHVQGAWSLGPRAYEIAACGGFQLCDDTRGELADIFGDTVPTYRDTDDLMGLVDYYLTHEAERQETAAAAREAVAGCTFDNRAANIVEPLLLEVIGYG